MGFDVDGEISRLDNLGIDVSGAISQTQKFNLLDDYFANLGKVILHHPTDTQRIAGNIYFPNLCIDKGLDKITLINDGHVRVENKLMLTQGKLQLNNSSLELGDINTSNGGNNNLGVIENEGHQHYVELDGNSFIVTQRFITKNETNSFGGIGITFTPSEEANYTIYRWQQTLGGAGSGSIPRYYRIATDLSLIHI